MAAQPAQGIKDEAPRQKRVESCYEFLAPQQSSPREIVVTTVEYVTRRRFDTAPVMQPKHPGRAVAKSQWRSTAVRPGTGHPQVSMRDLAR